MRRSAGVLIGIGLLASGCTSVAPDAGTEAVLIHKPIVFGSGGVDATTVKAGRQYVALTTEAVYIDMRPQQANIKFDDLMSRDGVPLDFDAAMRFQVTDAVVLVRQFGADIGTVFTNNVEMPFRSSVRDSVKRRGMNEMAIDSSAAEAVDKEVSEAVQAIIKRDALPIRLIDVTLGRANPPDAIKHQRIATAEQEQRQQTERQAKLAEDMRLEHEQSRARADNAYRLQMSLSPEQFLQLESIKAMRDVCGGGKCSIVTAGALPTFGIK